MEKEILPTTIPEFPTVRRMTLGMNSPLVVPSIFARAAAEELQKGFTDGWDPLFIGYTAAVYFHTSEMKINCCSVANEQGIPAISKPLLQFFCCRPREHGWDLPVASQQNFRLASREVAHSLSFCLWRSTALVSEMVTSRSLASVDTPSTLVASQLQPHFFSHCSGL